MSLSSFKITRWTSHSESSEALWPWMTSLFVAETGVHGMEKGGHRRSGMNANLKNYNISLLENSCMTLYKLVFLTPRPDIQLKFLD